MTQLVKAESFGLKESQANEITKGLSVVLTERDALIEAYNDVITLEISEDNISTFKDLRLMIRDNRTKGIEVWHKKNKEFYLRGGQFVDAIKNRESEINQSMESKLMDAEKYFENLEKKRIEDLNNLRKELVSPYLEDISNLFLADMDEDVFEAYLLTKKNNYLALIEAERKAEEERQAQLKAEQERIEAQRVENERLKAEAEAREKELEVERIANAKKLAEEQAKAKAEADKLRVENEAKLKAEQEAKAKLEAELKAKRDAEIKAEQDRQQAELKAKAEADKLAKAPIKKQLSKWVESFSIEIPSSELLNNELALDIKDKFEAFKKWSQSQINNL